MFSSRIHYSISRSITLQIPVLRTFRTSPCHFYSDRYSSEDGRETKKKRSFLGAIKEHKEKNMLIDEVPETESVGTLLKVQRVSDPIPKGFKTVYKFPQIKYLALVNRLKVYQTTFTLLACVGSSSLYVCGIIPGSFIITSTVFGLTGCLTLYSLGYAAENFVGFIYYNAKTDMARIAYVDFWGRRRDIEVPASDIVPRDETQVGLVNKLWHPLKRYSTTETLKLQLEQGIICDQKALKKIF